MEKDEDINNDDSNNSVIINIQEEHDTKGSRSENNNDIEECDIVIKKHTRKSSIGNSRTFESGLEGILERSHNNYNNSHNTMSHGTVSQLIIKDSHESDESVTSSWNLKHGVSKSMMTFIARFLLSSTMVAFCIARLSSGITADERTLYISMLSSTVSLWLPSPLQDKNKK